MINDECILSKYWHGKQQVFVRYMKSNKCLLNEIQYVMSRYHDSNSIEETLYRMKNHIEECPTCKTCGKKLTWSKKHGYHIYCSRHCKNLDPIQISKRQQGVIGKFGVNNPFSSKEVYEKRTKTWNWKYGGNPFSSKEIREKARKTYLDKYGDDPFSSKEIREKTRKTCLDKYGVDNYAKTKEFKERLKETCFRKYGAYSCNLETARLTSHSKEANEKRYATMRKNNSWSTSNSEEDFYDKLCLYFDKTNIIRNYNEDKRYPFHCDFYVISLDLFIECNFHWTHGKHPYNPNSIKDQVVLERWKSKKTKYYDNAMQTWTIRDVKKRNKAKENNLNYVELYDESDVHDFYIGLDKTINKDE